jgi:hypothetical protein
MGDLEKHLWKVLDSPDSEFEDYRIDPTPRPK